VSAAKAVVGLVVLAGVVGVGAVVGDHYAEARAEEYARDVVAQSISTTMTPAVDIKGFPFLTQLLSGTLGEVTGAVGGATLGGIPMTDVQLDARDVLVRPPVGQQPRAGHATVAATIPTSSIAAIVQQRAGVTTQLAVSGSALTATAKVLNLPLELALVPRVQGGQLLVDLRSLRLNGATVTADQLPSAFRTRIQGIQVPVEGLPKGLSLSNAVVVPQGVRITTDGTDVEVPQAPPG
jgi:hypothetical protein